MSAPMERLQTLDTIEKEILAVLQTASSALYELGKEKPSNKQIESHTNTFLKTLNHVEVELAKQINYLTQVSTGQAHEGSSYASQKVLQMAWHRSEHARSRVVELDRSRGQIFSFPGSRLQARTGLGSLPSLSQPITGTSVSSTSSLNPGASSI